MPTDWSPLRAAVSKAGVLAVLAFRRMIGATRAVAWTTWRLLRWLAHGFGSLSTAAYSRVATVFVGPVTQFVAGPLRVTLLGKRRDVSLLSMLLSPGLALITAWWVGSTVGFETVMTWVSGTWFGTDPSLPIFLAVGSLLALGAISAAVNSGLLPTSILVSAPIFGAGVTRYGTTLTYTWEGQLVSLPNAVGMAIQFALGFGLPIAIAGFLLGRALSRVLRVYRGHTGPSSTVDNA